MRISINANRRFYFAFIATFLAMIVVFPITHSGDGWGYAADTLEYQGNISSLLSPHHLLYMPWCALWLPLIKFLHINPIAGFTFLNFALCVITLEVLRSWLLKLNTTPSNAQWLIWFLLGSFGILRFALDNETYIAPLFLAISGSFLIENKQPSRASLGWILLALSVLFHQSYIFWFLAFAVSAIKHGNWKAPALSGGIIIATYVIAANAFNENIMDFLFHDVNQGLVETKLGLMNVVFTCVNLVRTVFQIHGFIAIILVAWPLPSIIGLCGLLLLIISSAVFFWRYFSKRKQQQEARPIFTGTLSWVFFLQLGFAFYSVGNAEFMVMLLPIATLLMAKAGLFSADDKTTNPLVGSAIGTWIYHSVFVLIPMFLGANSDVEHIATTLNNSIPHNNSQKIVFISNQAKAIENAWEYIARKNDMSPAKNVNFNMGSSEKDIQEIETLSKDSQVQIMTDDVFTNGRILNRASATTNSSTKKWISEQRWDTFKTILIASPKREITLYRLRK